MKVLLTGGSGDLGANLASRLIARGDLPVNLDVRNSAQKGVEYVPGSITDRQAVELALRGVDTVVHIAAWHGIHEFRQEKDAFAFWDLNVTGTFTLLECCALANISKFVFISSTSVDSWPGIYAHSKLLCEDLMRTYVARHQMSIVSLRPRAFIPATNKAIYPKFADWAKWFWKGAVHIDDVAQATLLGVDFVQSQVTEHAAVTIDGACEFGADELAAWDMAGAGSTFKNRFGDDAYKLFVSNGLDPAKKPKMLGYAAAEKLLGYKPAYGIAALIKELSQN